MDDCWLVAAAHLQEIILNCLVEAHLIQICLSIQKWFLIQKYTRTSYGVIVTLGITKNDDVKNKCSKTFSQLPL